MWIIVKTNTRKHEDGALHLDVANAYERIYIETGLYKILFPIAIKGLYAQYFVLSAI